MPPKRMRLGVIGGILGDHLGRGVDKGDFPSLGLSVRVDGFATHDAGKMLFGFAATQRNRPETGHANFPIRSDG